jgi:hypothetical protein
MSYGSTTTPARSSKVARIASALRRNWSEARYADRRLMEMRTDLARHAGPSVG